MLRAPPCLVVALIASTLLTAEDPPKHSASAEWVLCRDAILSGDNKELRRISSNLSPEILKSCDHGGWNLLHFAVHHNNFSAVEALLKLEFDPNRETLDGLKSLDLARSDAVHDRLRRANADWSGSINALRSASLGNNLFALKKMIEIANVDINAKLDKSEITLLHDCAFLHNWLGVSRIAFIRWLLKNGASVLERDVDGLTPLDYSADEDVAQILLAAGSPEGENRLAQMKVSYRAGNLARFQKAISRVEREELKQHCLDEWLFHSISPSFPDEPKSKWFGFPEVLLRYGANPNAKLAFGRTALHQAIMQGQEAIYHLIAEKYNGATDIKDDLGLTPEDYLNRYLKDR